MCEASLQEMPLRSAFPFDEFEGRVLPTHQCRVCCCGAHDLDEIVVVAFTGHVADGSAGNRACAYALHVVECAILQWQPRCLVLDLTGLSYTYGDSIGGLFVQPLMKHRGLHLYAAVSDLCEKGLTSLLTFAQIKRITRIMERLHGCSDGFFWPARQGALDDAHRTLRALPPVERLSLDGFLRSLREHVASGDTTALHRFLDDHAAFIRSWESTHRFTPLMLAAHEGLPAFAEWLVSQHEDVNDGSLYIATKHGYREIVRMLVAAGAQVNCPDRVTSPLHAAAGQGDLQMVRFLLARGADTLARDARSYAPIQRARRSGHTAVVEHLDRQDRRLVERVTDEQRRDIAKWRDRWVAIGLSCEPVDSAKAETAVRRCYKAAGLHPPSKVITLKSPFVARRIANAEEVSGHGSVAGQIRDRVLVRTCDDFRRRVPHSLWRRLDRDLAAGVALRTRPFQLGVAAAVDEYVSMRSSDCGPHPVNLLALCEYLIAVIGLPASDNIVGLFELAQFSGWWIPLKRVALLQERPVELHLNAAGLHRDGGAAVRYRDGHSVWMLNGVAVPQWLAETCAEDLDPRRIREVPNTEVRREFVRKVGIERVCHASGAECVDKEGDYELIELDLGDGRRRPFLKMLNPSIGTWHVEGVHPRCLTVAEALAWRNETDQPPEVLT